jgi:hypothetical protein
LPALWNTSAAPRSRSHGVIGSIGPPSTSQPSTPQWLLPIHSWRDWRPVMVADSSVTPRSAAPR